MAEFNNEIIAITMQIERLFPELSKFIAEMPVDVSNVRDNEITAINLKEYYESLESLLKNYAASHISSAK